MRKYTAKEKTLKMKIRKGRDRATDYLDARFLNWKADCWAAEIFVPGTTVC